MLKPHPRKREWFLYPMAKAGDLAMVPLVKLFDQTTVEIPRSMLILFQDGRDYLENELNNSNLELEQRCLNRNAKTALLGYTLRPHQHIGVEFASRRRGTLIADSPRTGKTISGLSMHDPSSGRLLVIAPLPTREVWLGWIKRAFPHFETSVIIGKNFDRAQLQAPIVFGHYDVLSAWQDMNLQLGTVIFDEAHILSKRSSQRTKAAAFLASRAEKVIALTGTPLWNKPQGLWPLLGLVAPGQFGGFHDFAERYSNATKTQWGIKYDGTANEIELKQRLTEVMIHRRWEDIAQDLPKVTRDILLVDLTHKERLDVDLVTEAARAGFKSNSTIGSLASYRATLAKIKAPVAIKAAQSDLDSGERVVIWCWHRETAREIQAELSKSNTSFMVTGEVSSIKRDKILQEWRETPASALVITIAVGQVGIDLSASYLAIFAEVDFTPALIAQAEMRTYTPIRPMNVRYVIADHPTERAIIDALRLKLDTGDAIGVPAAEAAIDVLKNAFALPGELEGDVDRLLHDLLESCNLE